ncbi:MAG: PAS domain S-box protein [Candidatus Altiarchaeota archaeon]|nr:PAS domain S-box protein [Candidatus Altiarchaeota archaeon]
MSQKGETHELEVMVEALLQNSEETIVTVNQASMVLYYNRLLPGIHAQKGLGMSLDDYLPKEQQEAFGNEIGKIFQEDDATALSFNITDTDGKVREYAAKFSPVRDGNTIVATIITIRDVTTHNELERENRKLKGQLIELSRVVEAHRRQSQNHEETQKLKNQVSQLASENQTLKNKVGKLTQELEGEKRELKGEVEREKAIEAKIHTEEMRLRELEEETQKMKAEGEEILKKDLQTLKNINQLIQAKMKHMDVGVSPTIDTDDRAPRTDEKPEQTPPETVPVEIQKDEATVNVPTDIAKPAETPVTVENKLIETKPAEEAVSKPEKTEDLKALEKERMKKVNSWLNEVIEKTRSKKE